MYTSLLIHPEELDQIWLDELDKLGVKTLGLHPVGGVHADDTLKNMLFLFKQPEYQEKLNKAKDMGINIACEMHTLRHLLSSKEIEEHPEWQRVNKEGQRSTDYNFCCSNPEALQHVVKNAIELFKSLPGNPQRASFWLDDAPDAFCHCEKCAHLSPSDQQLIILNAIVDGLRTVRPDAMVPYLAYFEALPAPTQVKPHEGIYLQYAPYLRDITKPINDAENQHNGEYIAHISNLLSLFGTKESTVLEYWYDNSLFSKYTKPPKELHVDNDVVRTDIAYYRALGFENISSFACYLGQDYRELFGMPDLSAFHL